MDRQYKFKETHVCRRCKGEGIIMIPGDHVGNGRFSEPVEEVCNLCNGSGLVEIAKEINVNISPKTPKPYANKK